MSNVLDKFPAGIVRDPVYAEHKPGSGHPECPARYQAALDGTARVNPPGAVLNLGGRTATEDELALCHTREYIRIVQEDVRDTVRCLRTGDTDLSERSYEAARHAAGGALAAVDAVIRGSVRAAFCPVRPPGHHASQDRGMGFCIFNNIAIAARHAQRNHGIERVLVADWDVHHGNGTQQIFYEDPGVFYFSTHQWPAYPGTGRAGETGGGAGRGFTQNYPFAMGAGGRDLIGAFREKLVPAMRKFRPQLVLVSAGFDALVSDPLGGFAVTPDDFGELTAIVLEIANEHAEGRLVSVLEGGYDLQGLAECVRVHVQRLVEGR